MFAAVRDVLASEPRVAYGLVFGSCARGADHAHSDLDIAVGVSAALGTHDLGDLIGRLEAASGRTVDLVLLNEATMALAYRVFRDGVVVFERDRQARVRREARAVLDYLDFRPIEDLCTRGVLEAAKRG